MFNNITTLYKNMRRRMELKKQYRSIFDTLVNYLYEFLSQGKQWALKCAYNVLPENPRFNSGTEYLYQINVKCGWANNLIQRFEHLRNKLIEYCGDKSKTHEYIDQAMIVLKSTRELLKSSVDVVPYTKIDNFNQYIYQVEQELNSINQSSI